LPQDKKVLTRLAKRQARKCRRRIVAKDRKAWLGFYLESVLVRYAYPFSANMHYISEKLFTEKSNKKVRR